MQSLVHLYNTALSEIGGEQIPQNISPIEEDAVGAICQNIFPHVLNTALESHDWGFARARSVLALKPEEEPRNHEYRFRYILPADCVRPIGLSRPFMGTSFPVNDDPLSAYVIEGEYILCDVPQAELLYVSKVTEPKRWPSYFADILVWKMAAGLASSRLNDMQKKQRCDQMAELALARACAMDRAFNKPLMSPTPWQIARGNRGVNPPRGWRW